MKLWPGWLVVLAAACGLGSSAEVHPTTAKTAQITPEGSPMPHNATVVRVVDGDTIDAEFGNTEVRVRLIGIDTPETQKPNSPIECFGPEASDFTKQALPAGTEVLVVRDVEARDDYGRLLGYVYRAADSVFVNLELARQGLARPLTIAPNNAHAAEIVAAARTAEAQDLGLWAACRG